MLQDFKRTSIQGGLAGGEKVELTFTLLFNGNFFKMLNAFGMWLLNGTGLINSLSLCLHDGCWAMGFCFLDRVSTSGLCLPDGTGTESLCFLDGLLSFGLILVESHTKLGKPTSSVGLQQRIWLPASLPRPYWSLLIGRQCLWKGHCHWVPGFWV